MIVMMMSMLCPTKKGPLHFTFEMKMRSNGHNNMYEQLEAQFVCVSGRITRLKLRLSQIN